MPSASSSSATSRRSTPTCVAASTSSWLTLAAQAFLVAFDRRASFDPATRTPGRGRQFLYRKLNRVQLESWIPVGTAGSAEPLGEIGGILHRPGAFSALVPTKQEWWLGADGAGRTREVVGTPRFLTAAERRRWESAGSPLPHPFDPAYQALYKATAFPDALELRRGVVDTEHQAPKGFRFPDTSASRPSPKPCGRRSKPTGSRSPASTSCIPGRSGWTPNRPRKS